MQLLRRELVVVSKGGVELRIRCTEAHGDNLPFISSDSDYIQQKSLKNFDGTSFPKL